MFRKKSNPLENKITLISRWLRCPKIGCSYIFREFRFPSDDKAPIIEGCYGWAPLVACRVGVDLELYPTFHASAIIPLPIDAIGIPILAIALPSDDKAPIIEGCYGWVLLVACRVGVDLELYPTFHASAIIPLPVDAKGISILARALPSGDKAPIIEGCYAWESLVVCRVGVDLELYPTFHSAAIIPLPVDAKSPAHRLE
ncbi:MAG: hypothetical protein K940chlam9_02063 [Chlamydiae bacterium]|nr:hypothetical protein [Chlamydiota bacterium]